MKKYFKQLKANKKGFTLIEMIVVIAIIGILAAILVPSMAGYLSEATGSRDVANAKMVYTAAQAAVTSLEATKPVTGSAAGTEYKKTVDTDNTGNKRKDLFDKIAELMGTSNYEKYSEIIVKVGANKEVINVSITEKIGNTTVQYPK